MKRKVFCAALIGLLGASNAFGAQTTAVASLSATSNAAPPSPQTGVTALLADDLESAADAVKDAADSVATRLGEDDIPGALEAARDRGIGTLRGALNHFDRVMARFQMEMTAITGYQTSGGDLVFLNAIGPFTEQRAYLESGLRSLFLGVLLDGYTGPTDPHYLLWALQRELAHYGGRS